MESEHIGAIRTALPQAPEYHVAKGAGRFAYLAPCAQRLAEAAREICEDPEGFDRVAWHSHDERCGGFVPEAAFAPVAG